MKSELSTEPPKWSVRSRAPVAASYTASIMKRFPATTIDESGENLTVNIRLPPVRSHLIVAPVVKSYTANKASSPPQASNCPSGLNATAFTSPSRKSSWRTS